MTNQKISTNPPETNTTNDLAFQKVLGDINKIDKKVAILEGKIRGEESYFKSIKRLSSTTIIILILMPVMLLCTSVALFVYYCNDIIFIGIVKFVIGLLGIGCIIELLYVPFKMHSIEQRLDKLEEK